MNARVRYPTLPIIVLAVLYATPIAAATAGPPTPPPEAAEVVPGLVEDHAPTGTADWERLWRTVWLFSDRSYDIRAAGTVAHVPLCQGDLGIDKIVAGAIRAVGAERYGDATRLLGEFQDRLMCVTPTGARGIEYALSALVHLALSELPAEEQRLVVHGAFNLGLLVFDQVQYTGRSWWLTSMFLNTGAVGRQLRAGYPGRELGLWFYDTPAAALVYHGFDARRAAADAVTGPMLQAFGDPSRFGAGECDLLALAAAGFHCTPPAAAGLGGGGGGGGGGMPGPSGDGMTACVTAAAMAGGHYGTLACMARAGGGGTLRHAPDAHRGPTVRGVLDDQCAMSSEGEGEGDSYADQRRQMEDGFEDFVHEFQQDMARLAQQHAWRDAEQRAVDEARADAQRQVDAAVADAQRQAEAARIEARLAAIEARLAEVLRENEEQRERIRELEEGQDQRPGPDGDGACADGTNAAQRVANLLSCMGAAGISTGLDMDEGRDPVAMPGPDATPRTGGPSAMLSCALQGGGLVRTAITDDRCQVTTCPQGSDTCTCDGGATGRGPGLMPSAAMRELEAFRTGEGRRGGLTDPPRHLEYDRLMADLSGALGDVGQWAMSREREASEDIEALARATGWDARLIALAAVAASMSDETGIPQDGMYALLRAGLPTDAPQLARVNVGAVEQALTRAVDTGVASLDEGRRAEVLDAFEEFSHATRLREPAVPVAADPQAAVRTPPQARVQEPAHEPSQARHRRGRADGSWALKMTPRVGMYLSTTDLGQVGGESVSMDNSLAFGAGLEFGAPFLPFNLRASFGYATDSPITSGVSDDEVGRSTVLVVVADAVLRTRRVLMVQPYLVLGGGLKQYGFDRADTSVDAFRDSSDPTLHIGGGLDLGLRGLSLNVELSDYISRFEPEGAAAETRHDLFLSLGLAFGLF